MVLYKYSHMTQIRKRMSLGLSLIFAIVGVALPASAAVASSGEITRAEANADWTLASIAGSVTWDECTSVSSTEPWEPEVPEPISGPACWLEPFVTIGPGSEVADCFASDRQWAHSGGELHLAWSGGTHILADSMTFDVEEVPLSGTSKPLACLSLVEYKEKRPVCKLGEICPQYIGIDQTYAVLASAVLTTSDSPSESEGMEEPELEAGIIGGPDEGSSASPPLIPQPQPDAKPQRCPKGKHHVKRAGHTVCKHRRHRHHHHRNRRASKK